MKCPCHVRAHTVKFSQLSPHGIELLFYIFYNTWSRKYYTKNYNCVPKSVVIILNVLT